MKLQQLMLGVIALATLDVCASTGLTSAGVTPQQQAPQDEPTLAQVAPTPGTSGTAPISIAGNPVPGTAVPVSGAAAPNAPNAQGANAPAQAAPPKVVAPPPPPDPATLPVSVIRPLNKAGASAAPAGDAPAPPPPAEPAPGGDAMPAGRTPHAPASAAKAPLPTGSTNLPVPTARVAGAASPRAEAPTKTLPDTPPEEPADASSSGVIFYTGSGIAAVVLLLSFAAFMRGSKEEGA